MSSTQISWKAIEIVGTTQIFSDEAIRFVMKLHQKFEPARQQLLASRLVAQERWDQGFRPGFLQDTEPIRTKKWQIASIPEELLERTIEITGPADRKMMINALNSPAQCYMCDLEDSLSPTWPNIVKGQINLYDAVHGHLNYYDSTKQKLYTVSPDRSPILMVRPRGWHLDESHFLVNGQTISGSLFDFGIFFYHNAFKIIQNGNAPYFYLPKLESYTEARLWNDIFNYAQDTFGIPRGSIKCTVLIEHLLAAFQMEEILYELRTHIIALNCGRWDYIFSMLKVFRKDASYLLPDRSQVTMRSQCMKAYVDLLVYTCHKRGAMAIGGMAAHIPVKDDPAQNQVNLDSVFQDKQDEAQAGLDGTWIAHPGLYQTAKRAFEQHSISTSESTTPIQQAKNQMNVLRQDIGEQLQAERGYLQYTKLLLKAPEGEITLQGIVTNLRASLLYLDAWLHGQGAVAIDSKMEDAATAEISRMQLWTWVAHKVNIHPEDTSKSDPQPQQIPVTLQLLRQQVSQLKQDFKPTVVRLLFQALEMEMAPDFITLMGYPLLDLPEI